MKTITASLAFIASLTTLAHSASISVNFSVLATGDAQLVDPGETSVTGMVGAESVDGSAWNNVRLLASGTSGAAGAFTTATQGGNFINLIDSSGADSLVDMTSSGAFFANTANVSGAASATTGDGGLMHGIMLVSSVETISLSGLAAWAPFGYEVRAFFDIGALVATRTYGVAMTDGTVSQTFWTIDTGAIDSDTNNDGVMVWSQSTATTSAAAVSNSNYAVYGRFTGNTLTISGTDPATRSVLSGFQVVAIPEPSSGILLAAAGLLLASRRRR